MARHKRPTGARTLALDPHIRRVGYAFFKDGQLADWGLRTARSDLPPIRLRRQLIPLLIEMLDQFAPALLIVPDVSDRGVRRSQCVREAIAVLTREARKRDIGVHPVVAKDVKSAFRDMSDKLPRNKTIINGAIVARYPELKSVLPRRRQTWEPEPYYEPLFASIAMYWGWRDNLPR